MTEFEKWWGENHSLLRGEKGGAKQLWDAAQRALLRTLANPPFIPEVGDEIKVTGLCHPYWLDKVQKVTGVTKTTLDVILVSTKTSDGANSSGFLSEVEKVN